MVCSYLYRTTFKLLLIIKLVSFPQTNAYLLQTTFSTISKNRDSFTRAQTTTKSKNPYLPQQDKSYHMKANEQEARWCEKQQIFINGPLPNESSDVQAYIEQILNEKQPLVLFGYGSLCWNPGDANKDTLAKVVANAERMNASVTSIGCAIGWKRCWCQQSTDHRGTGKFYCLFIFM